MRLTESQWGIVAPLILEPPRTEGRGRPRCDSRGVLEGVLWVLQTGAPWKDLPRRYPSHQTCHRRYQQWRDDGTLERVLGALADDLRRRGGVEVSAEALSAMVFGAGSGAHSAPASSPRRGPRPWQQRTAVVFRSPLTPWGNRPEGGEARRSRARGVARKRPPPD